MFDFASLLFSFAFFCRKAWCSCSLKSALSLGRVSGLFSSWSSAPVTSSPGERGAAKILVRILEGINDRFQFFKFLHQSCGFGVQWGLRCRFRVSCLGPCLFVVSWLASFTAASISSLHRRYRHSVSVGGRLALFIAS